MSSGDVINANPALTKAVQYARKRPVDPLVIYGLNAPGLFQYLNPNLPWSLGDPPNMITKLSIMRPMIVISLILANQNSASPKKDTAMMLRNRIRMRKIVIHTAA